jgi:hypothetical protein
MRESPRIYRKTFRHPSWRLTTLYHVKPIRGPFYFRVCTLSCPLLPSMYKYMLQLPRKGWVFVYMQVSSCYFLVNTCVNLTTRFA